MKNWFNRLAVAAALLIPSLAKAADPTDIDGVITNLGTYKTAAMVVGIALLLWVLGRRVVKKFV